MTVTAATPYRIRLTGPMSLVALTLGNECGGFQMLSRLGPSTALGISAAGSDARKAPQLTGHLRPSGSETSVGAFKCYRGWAPRLRSGFRLRAQTPAKRLNLQVQCHLRPSRSETSVGAFNFERDKIPRSARDFACGLKTPAKRLNLWPSGSRGI
jgi:hypothetical protein